MSFDFRGDQLRTNRIISSGSAPLLVYPSSSALNFQGGLSGFSTASIGTDVFFYVSGSAAKKSLFGGDIKISGSSLINILSGTNPDALSALGLGPGLFVSSSMAMSNSLVLLSGVDPTAERGGLIFNSGASLNMFSGALGDSPGLVIEPAVNQGTVQVNIRGDLNVSSGSVSVSVLDYPVWVYSGSSPSPGTGLLLTAGPVPDQILLTLTGSIQTDKLTSPQLTGSIRNVDGTNNFIAPRNMTANYNSTKQWELTGAMRQVSLAGYSRTNLTSSTVIGYGYFDPSQHPSNVTVGIEAVGMNMDGVSGTLSLYSQNDAATVTTLSWSGTSTLTTGSYQYSVFSLPANAKSYELHLNQTGGTNGGSSYTSVGFVNFRIT